MRKKNSPNFAGKDMISMLDDYDTIIKKLIIDHAWWFEHNIILLALKNSLMITMQTKMTKLNEKLTEDFTKTSQEICWEFRKGD